MLLFLFTLSIYKVTAEQPVIQYDTPEHAHLPSPHNDQLRLQKNLVIIPKVSHEVQYLSNPFRRAVDSSNVDSQSIKPVTELTFEPPAPTAPIAAALQASPTPDIFKNLNLNYDIPSYSSPEDFQNSVNALTHLMINKQVKFPSTSYGVPVTDTPEHVKQSTVNALLNMLIGIDKQKKQSDMLSQIVQFMHKKKMQQEQDTLVAQLQEQMQKEQYKPFLQSHEQAEGLVHFMQQLLGPLKQQGLGNLPINPTIRPTSASVPNLNVQSLQTIQSTSASIPESQFDWIPAKPSFPNSITAPTTHQTVVSSGAPSTMTYHQHFVPPTKPTVYQVPEPEIHSYSQSFPSNPKPNPHHVSPPHEKEGYVIRLSKPVLMKEELPASTTMPKIIHHYLQPVMPETLSKDIHERYNPKQSSSGSSHSHVLKGHSESHNSDMFAPKFEHYIMKHNHEDKSKPQLFKLSQEHKVHDYHDSSHAPSRHSPKHHDHEFDVVKLEQEFNNGVHHKQRQQHHHHDNHEHLHKVIEPLKFDDSKITYDFVNSNNDNEPETHIHTPFMTFNNHEFDQDFLKDFDNMHFKEENIPGYEDTKNPKKTATKGPQKFILLKKTTKRS